jgi:hypothetical protein
MRNVFGEDKSWVLKDCCCELEGHAMFRQVVARLTLVPFELHRSMMAALP